MDLFFVLVALLLLAFPIIAIAAFVKSVGLSEHLRRVEARHSCGHAARARAAGASTDSARRRAHDLGA